MVFSLEIILFIFLTQFLAYTVKGMVGFGNPLISGPILSMGMDNVVITPGTVLMDCPVNAYITWNNRKNFRWRQILPLLVFNMLGVIPGTLLLRFSLPWVLKTVLGVVVVFLGVEMATRNLRPLRPGLFPDWFRFVVAFFSGMCAGLFGINMFLTAYLQRTARDYSEFKGSICFLFLGENIFRICFYIANGIMNRSALLFGAVSLPATALAIFLAGKLSRKLPEDKLQKAAIALFLLGGISIIVKSLVFHT